MINQKKAKKSLKKSADVLGPWKEELFEMVIDGLYDYRRKKMVHGFVDAHTHLCRAYTYHQKYFPAGVNLNEIADSPLKAKQDLVGYLHEGEAYTQASLKERMQRQVKRSIRLGTREVWAVVDTTEDIGLRAFDIGLELKEKFADKINLKISSYPLFGFRDMDKHIGRYNVFSRAVSDCDFIVGLPEKDDYSDRIGFKRHCNILLRKAYKHKKPVHIHTDQVNSAYQKDSFRVIECLESLSPKEFAWFTKPRKTPILCLVHLISPSCYSGEEFSKLALLLKKYNIGVICCPVAGVSMRQLRSEISPIHNSLTRVIELLNYGVQVRIGTDNINDYLVPSGDGFVLSELFVLSNVVRHYCTHILAKIGMGIQLSGSDIAILSRSLYEAEKSYIAHEGYMASTRTCEKKMLRW